MVAAATEVTEVETRAVATATCAPAEAKAASSICRTTCHIRRRTRDRTSRRTKRSKSRTCCCNPNRKRSRSCDRSYISHARGTHLQASGWPPSGCARQRLPTTPRAPSPHRSPSRPLRLHLPILLEATNRSHVERAMQPRSASRGGAGSSQPFSLVTVSNPAPVGNYQPPDCDNRAEQLSRTKVYSELLFSASLCMLKAPAPIYHGQGDTIHTVCVGPLLLFGGEPVGQRLGPPVCLLL